MATRTVDPSLDPSIAEFLEHVPEGVRIAYTAVRAESDPKRWCLALCVEYEPGFHPSTETSANEAGPRAMAEILNKAAGLSLKEAALIVASTMSFSRRG